MSPVSWSYTSSSAGRAGTGYVNNYCGNLVWVREDLGYHGLRMPVTVNHIFNSNDAKQNDFGLGLGWRTNYNQLVYQWSENSSYYVWEDGDGTAHYFKHYSGNTYVDDDTKKTPDDDADFDDIRMTLTVGGTDDEVYVIEDKLGNTSCFDASGRLKYIRNNQNTESAVEVRYISTSSKLINKITDGAGRVYDFTYTNNLLSRISFKSDDSTERGYVTFAYNGNALTTITDADEGVCTYTYKNKMLESATDVDGYKLTYEYTSGNSYAPYRVNSIKESDGTATGGHMTISYGNNFTVFTDEVNGITQTHQFNDWGDTTAIMDDEGRAQYMGYARNDKDDTAGKANQLTLVSKMQNTVVNLVYDSSFELGIEWAKVNSADTVTFGADTAYKYLGSKSLMLENSSNETIYQNSQCNLEAGQTYTLSGYIKTTGAATAQLGLVGATSLNELSFTEAKSASGWTRVELHYTNTGTSTKAVRIAFRGQGNDAVYLDCVQLEKNPTASRYNLVQNGEFRRNATGWSATDVENADGIATVTDGAAPTLQNTAYKMTGSYTQNKFISQEIAISGKAGDNLVFGGWAKGQSASLKNFDDIDKRFRLKLTVYYTDGESDSAEASFNEDVHEWQFTSNILMPQKAYSSVKLYASFGYNAGEVYFDGIQVFQEEFGCSYEYNDDGKLTSSTDEQGKKTTCEYNDAGDLVEVVESDGTKTTNTYEDDTHNLLSTTVTHQPGTNTEKTYTYTYTYDDYGNRTSVTTTHGGKSITERSTYTAKGNLLSTTTDALDRTTTYHYNEDTGLLEYVCYPDDTENTQTNYTYDDMQRTTAVTSKTDANQSLYARYTYEEDQLKTLVTPSTTYEFTFGNFALKQSVQAGDKVLVNYTYESGTNRLTKQTYGNGQYVAFQYDAHGRLTQKSYADGSTTQYYYDNCNNIAKTVDSRSGITTVYYYDLINRLVGYHETSDTLDHKVTYSYDAQDRPKAMKETINGYTKNYTYTYNEEDKLASMTVDGITLNYTYDDFGRLETKTKIYDGEAVKTNNISYTGTSTTTSNQISSYNGWTYTYNNKGYIESVTPDANTTTYTYNSAGYLIREDNQKLGKSFRWYYNSAGNIIAKKTYEYTTGELGTALETINYTYGSEDAGQWNDLLTGYNGQTLTYNDMGSLKSDGTWNYYWKRGRELGSMVSDDTTWTYSYNGDGIRIGRTDGTNTYTYIYNGDKLTRVQYNSKLVRYNYDESGNPISLRYNNVLYLIDTNLQGDVVGIRETEENSRVVNYVYDAYGKICSITGSLKDSLGVHNVLRYRGYVYDQETGLYYLQSRYYNPEWGRFISADVFAYTGQGFAGYNMFVYCNNNPVNYSDAIGLYPVCITIDSSSPPSLPVKGDPNTSQVLYNPDGTVKQKRWYGKDGVAERDRDNNHQGKGPFPHDHEWKNGKRSKDHLPPSPEYKFSWKPVIGIALVTACTVGTIVIAIDDASGVGVVDDFLLAPLTTGIGKGLSMIFC